MQRRRILGLGLVVAFALSASAVESASAAPPEFGKCVAKAGGKYKNNGCSLIEAGKEKYEWEPYSTLVKTKFKSHLSEGISTLETEAGTKITCGGESFANAEYTGPKTVGNVIIRFTGCEAAGLQCHSAGEPEGDETSFSLDGVLGIQKTNANPAKDLLAVELHGPGGGALMEFECGALAKIGLTGSVLQPVSANKMLLSERVKFAAVKAEQKPDHFAGGIADEHTLFAAENGATPEEAGWTRAELLEDEERIEASSANG